MRSKDVPAHSLYHRLGTEIFVRVPNQGLDLGEAVSSLLICALPRHWHLLLSHTHRDEAVGKTCLTTQFLRSEFSGEWSNLLLLLLLLLLQLLGSPDHAMPNPTPLHPQKPTLQRWA